MRILKKEHILPRSFLKKQIQLTVSLTYLGAAVADTDVVVVGDRDEAS